MAVITLSRQIGTNSEAIAAQVCERLGYRYFDKQLMIEAAAEVGLCEDEVIDFSEDKYVVQDFLSRLFRSRSRTLKQLRVRQEHHTGVVDTLDTRNLDEAECVDLVRSTVLHAYQLGNILIAGRGGQAILHHKPGVLHVRLIAPQDTRIERLRQQGQSGIAEIKLRIAQQDRATEEYLRRFFEIQCDDPTLYHLVINTGKLDLDAVAGIIIDAVQWLHHAHAA